MNTVKFEQMIREFPFVAHILNGQDLWAETIGNIEVARVDENLLSITPFAESHDAGEYGDYSKSRHFWYVLDDDIKTIVTMDSAWCRSQVPHGVKGFETALPIGAQLLPTTKKVLFIVELYRENANDGEGESRYVVVYKMHDLDWRKRCRHMQNEVDAWKQYGKPNWSSHNVPEGKDLSEQFKVALGQPHGVIDGFHNLLRSLRDEPALFLRVDLRDLKDPDGAKYLKGWLESDGKPSWPKVQKRTAVLVCSLEERAKYSGIFDNLFCSGVKWERRF